MKKTPRGSALGAVGCVFGVLLVLSAMLVP